MTHTLYNKIQPTDGGRYALISLPEHADARGTLCVADGGSGDFPFVVQRAFWLYDIPGNGRRGEHAHHTCHEVVIPVRGRFTAHVSDGTHEAHFVMDNRCEGLYIPAMVWCSFSDFSDDCLCLCLASESYDESGYINDYAAYLQAVREAEP
jgi:dTDP-4-dehydrorhamnose 3,5-epimerase-like enzyme